MADLSPMMKQYLEIKQQHKDEILFYRIGDFYEMFFDDAITASRELDLTLTGKQCGLEERAPMCGVPFHSYETYMARLIAKGYKVAICEQVEDPATAKGLVKRDIVRVVTPGTVIESSMLQDDRNNYIASLYLKGEQAGVCFADVSTGTAHVTELSGSKIGLAVIGELCRYHPSEVLINTGILSTREVTNYIKKYMNCAVELMEDERYAPGLIETTLAGQFGRDWANSTEIGANSLVKYAMGGLSSPRPCGAGKSGALCCGCWTRLPPPWVSGCCAAGWNSPWFPARSSTTGSTPWSAWSSTRWPAGNCLKPFVISPTSSA